MATDIVMTDLTNGALDANLQWTGAGIFDKLLIAVNKNIAAQYDLGRIKGTDYANVYLGGIQAVLAQSVQILLQEKQIEAEIDIKKEQSAKDLLLKTQQITSMVADDTIKAEQSAKDLLVKDSQVESMRIENSIKIEQSEKDLLVKDSQVAKDKHQIESMRIEDSIKIEQSAADVRLKNVQSNEVDLLLYNKSSLMEAQKAAELAKVASYNADSMYKAGQESLLERQKVFYDEQLKVEKAKAFKDYLGMVAAGGIAIDPKHHADLVKYIEDIVANS